MSPKQQRQIGLGWLGFFNFSSTQFGFLSLVLGFDFLVSVFAHHQKH